MSSILDTASYVRLQHAFKLARWTIMIWLLIAAAGVIAFAATAHPDASELTVPAPPEAATFDVPDSSKEDIDDQLGSECGYSMDALPVVVTSLDDEGAGEAISVPSHSCKPVRLSVTRSRLNVRA